MCLSVITLHVLAVSLVSEVICGALVLASPRLLGVTPLCTTTAWYGMKTFQCPMLSCPEHVWEVSCGYQTGGEEPRSPQLCNTSPSA